MNDTQVNPYRYRPPCNHDETVSFANAHSYEWSYLDTCRRNSDALIRAGHEDVARLVLARKVRDGWPYAYLEYTRRATTHKMAIREAFEMWLDTGTLPGLD